jgi:hypothetical protein
MKKIKERIERKSAGETDLEIQKILFARKIAKEAGKDVENGFDVPEEEEEEEELGTGKNEGKEEEKEKELGTGKDDGKEQEKEEDTTKKK